MKQIKCPRCGYDGSDLEIGRRPICQKMMCSKCKMYFYPFEKTKTTEEFREFIKKHNLTDIDFDSQETNNE